MSFDQGNMEEQCDMGQSNLRREVMQPHKQSTGVGVMLVASAAIFFATASSAFILRAQHNAQHRAQCNSLTTPVFIKTIKLVNPSEVETRQPHAIKCEPKFHETTDGSLSLTYKLCK